MQELQRFGSDIKVLFDTFSFKKKYYHVINECPGCPRFSGPRLMGAHLSGRFLSCSLTPGVIRNLQPKSPIRKISIPLDT